MISKIVLALVLSLNTSNVLAGNAIATYYSDYYQGKTMTNGQKYSSSSNTVATNRYKLGTRLKICYKGRCVIGVVRDRCNCSIDLSKALFRQLAPLKKGRIPVKVFRN